MRSGWWLAVLLPACSFTPGPLPLASDGGADAAIDADPGTGWSTPVLLAGISDPAGNDDPSLTSDLLEIYFGSYRDGGMGAEDIWFAKRNSVDEDFGSPMPATMLNSSAGETTAKLTGNGKAIYFASDRAVTGNFDIYFATRTEIDQPWTTPVRIAELSTDNGDWAPYAQTDQLRLILCSGATEAQEALFVTKRSSTSAGWSSLVRVDELDVPNISECDPIEPRANVLYYGSDHLNADGTFDIYRASKIASTEPYGNRTPISINKPGIDDRDPWVSPDERTLVFTSNRDLVNNQIYISTR